MPTTQTNLFPPAFRGAELGPQVEKFLLTLQMLLPLNLVDTSTGGYAETPPPAGLNAATGQSNQNMEITYVKSSADGNTYTLNGVEGGPYTLTAQFSFLKIKSDGTNWWRTG